jgi:flagellar hook-associated protein 1 FlgK
MSLFTSLTSASRALDAQRAGLDVTGQNIANVNTPGYSRRAIEFQSLPSDGAGSAGRGVHVVAVRALRDRLLEARLQQEVPAQRKEAAMHGALSVVEAAIGTPGSSIDKRLQNFFDAYARLAESPISATARQDVLLQAENLTTAFRDMSTRLAEARGDADRQVRSAVEEVNALAGQIASLNTSIASSPSPQASLHLRDDQAQLVRRLTELVNVKALERAEGGYDISIGSGRPIVVGATSYDVTLTSTPPYGFAALAVNGATITSEMGGGSVGGLLEVRDVKVLDYQQRLDQLAYDIANEVNTRHTAGYDQTGAAAGDLFEFSPAITPPAGAAAAIRVVPAVAADSRLLSAAGIANGGDNQNARAIAALREQRVLNGSSATLSDAWGEIVYRVARDTKSAADATKNREEVVRQVDALRDEVSGVSLDEEAMQLIKFQRAYEANARFFSVIDQTIEMLLTRLGR